MENRDIKSEIVSSEDWSGFTFVFSNGWSVSIQQSKAHHCTKGKSAEVAIFDPQDRWYSYCESSCDISVSEEETCVNGWLNADDVGRIISIISRKEVDEDNRI